MTVHLSQQRLISGVASADFVISLAAGGDLGQGLVEVLGRHGLAVEIGVAQFAEQVEDSLALVGEGDDARGLTLRRRERAPGP